MSADLGLTDGDALWRNILAAYSEPHRHYHGLSHIAAVVARFDTVRDQFEDPGQALLALFFHDIIYEPARRDNEALSADRLREALPGIDTARACRHILATTAHQPSDDPDTNLVLDIDMSVLGASWPAYLAYARGVFHEYVPVYGLEAYAAGRVALFLTPTLARDHIFLTQSFAARDAQAKQNLSAERDLWQTGQFAPI
ncbi:hypothetical protein ABI_02170 [Asticcacaulis biprosthecium C19]|uniref:Metal-dependent HD superfamily phosphohydrolase n=1 Tax=Asticcacaulis biprosthecium C19 TaxID=715226 RepID=F4QIM7_9CAUL|nr:hypothetical protein [Asticcacaulis biprosthecium]EGF91786.1 hypothetical protein ABI_02170 [Asticcacaulis biprosthecium C19]